MKDIGGPAGRPRTSAAARLARGLWPDHNPLRRAADRAEAAIAAVLLAAFLVGFPVAAITAGHWAYAAGKHVQRSERADRHRVRAVLLHDVSKPSYSSYGEVMPPVLARWTAPDGMAMTGLVNVDRREPAGTVIKVWTDVSGRLVSPPLPEAQVSRQAALAAAGAPVMLAIVLLFVWTLARSALDKRRLAAWDADWQVTGPLWTSRR